MVKSGEAYINARAAGNGDETVVRLLLDKGAEPESKDECYGQTPLLSAAGDGHESCGKAIYLTRTLS
jgi:ankyrin repeat protein